MYKPSDYIDEIRKQVLEEEDEEIRDVKSFIYDFLNQQCKTIDTIYDYTLKNKTNLFCKCGERIDKRFICKEKDNTYLCKDCFIKKYR
jgi:predicted RNA-binding Zn-ribbon protein involved in translation (DUF1610 family)